MTLIDVFVVEVFEVIFVLLVITVEFVVVEVLVLFKVPEGFVFTSMTIGDKGLVWLFSFIVAFCL